MSLPKRVRWRGLVWNVLGYFGSRKRLVLSRGAGEAEIVDKSATEEA